MLQKIGAKTRFSEENFVLILTIPKGIPGHLEGHWEGHSGTIGKDIGKDIPVQFGRTFGRTLRGTFRDNLDRHSRPVSGAESDLAGPLKVMLY